MSEYNLKIIKALNGFLVINNKNQDEIFLVNEDQNLGEAIMAALVSQKLEGAESKGIAKMTTSEIDDLLYEKSKWEAERQKMKDERDHYKREMDRYQYTSGANNQGLWATGAAAAQQHDQRLDAQRYAAMVQNAGLNSSVLDALQDKTVGFGPKKKKEWL